MDTRRCPACEQILPLTIEHWNRSSGRAGGFDGYCKPCSRVKKKESDRRLKEADPEGWAKRRRGYVASYKQRHPDRVRESEKRTRLKGVFGITLEQYNELLDSQGGVCAICNAAPSKKMLAVDHEHESNVVRGLLCSNCNTGIGLLADDPSRLEIAIEYLRREQ